MLAIAPDGTFTAAPDAHTVVHRSRGSITTHTSLSARSLSLCPEQAAAILPDGAIITLAHERRHRWSIDPVPEGVPCAVSPCATHVFNGTHLLSRSSRAETILAHEPFTRDFFVAFTRAAFVDRVHLALLYETGQPWSEHGSYGDRLKNVQIVCAPMQLSTVFYWCDTRQWDEEFEPTAFAFAPPARLALSHRDELWLTEDRTTRVNWAGFPEFTSDAREHWLLSRAASRLVLHPNATLIAARFDDRVSIFDPLNERRADLALSHDAFDFHGSFFRWLDRDSLSIEHAPLTELEWGGMYD